MLSQVLTQIRTSMEDRGFPRDMVESLPVLVNDLENLKVQNIAGWLREVKSRLDEKEQYLDVWAQGWFAWAFAFNGFAMTMNPSGSIGPDLLVKVRSQDIFVEVRRFRTDYEERKRLEEGGPDGELVPYGDFSKDVRRVLDAVQAKSRQGKGIPDGSSYMVAIRSDKDSIEELEFQDAVSELEAEAQAGGGRYPAIGAVFFHNGWKNLPAQTLWYVWRNPHAAPGRCPSAEITEKFKALSLPPTHIRHNTQG